MRDSALQGKIDREWKGEVKDLVDCAHDTGETAIIGIRLGGVIPHSECPLSLGRSRVVLLEDQGHPFRLGLS